MGVADMGRLPDGRKTFPPRARRASTSCAQARFPHARPGRATPARRPGVRLHLPARTCWGGRVGAL